jgi:hypothetical protein
MLPNQQDQKAPLLQTPQDQREAMKQVLRASGLNRSALNAIEAADAIIDATVRK